MTSRRRRAKAISCGRWQAKRRPSSGWCAACLRVTEADRAELEHIPHARSANAQRHSDQISWPASVYATWALKTR